MIINHESNYKFNNITTFQENMEEESNVYTQHPMIRMPHLDEPYNSNSVHSLYSQSSQS